MVGGLASGSLSAHVGVGLVAGILALQTDTGFVGGAIPVPGALGVAPGVGITQEVRRAAALGTVVHGLTVGILPAGSPGAGVLTPVEEAVTLLGGPALGVPLTLVPAALQRVANVGVLTPADGPVVRSDLAVSVDPTGSADLSPGEAPAVPEWISSGSLGTPADSHVVLDSTVSPLATGQRAGVHTLVVLAGPLGSTVSILVTLPGYTASVGISLHRIIDSEQSLILNNIT